MSRPELNSLRHLIMLSLRTTGICLTLLATTMVLLPSPTSSCTCAQRASQHSANSGCCCSAMKVDVCSNCCNGNACCNRKEPIPNGCNCGMDCECYKTTTEIPLSTPLKNRDTERIDCTLATATFSCPINYACNKNHTVALSNTRKTLATALQRCALLCRFAT